MKFLILALFITGCAIPRHKPTKNRKKIVNKNRLTNKQKKQRQVEFCVVRLLNEGFEQELIYPICKDIYGSKTRRTRRR